MKAREVRREVWERWKSRLVRHLDGTLFNPEGIDESFFRSLEEVRREPWAKRYPFGSDS